MRSMTEISGDRDHIQSLERGFAVLQAFDEEHPRPNLAELAAITGYSRPAVRRILLTLQRLGYVDNEGPRWSLTPRVLSIGAHYTASHALADIAQPHLASLCERTGESASLGVLDGAEAVYVARVPARRVVSITANVGTRVLAHATAMGRVLLAHTTPDVIERYLTDPGLRPLTPHTITDPDQFRATLERTRRQGWSMVSEEREVGLITVSAPVRDHHGAVVAAVSSSSSTGRSSPGHMEKNVVPLAVDTARRISTDLGHHAGHVPVVRSRDGFY
jgi:IclR family pca regulon transcriptional regulator